MGVWGELASIFNIGSAILRPLSGDEREKWLTAVGIAVFVCVCVSMPLI